MIYIAHLLVVTPPLISPSSCYKTGPVALTLSLPLSLSLRIGTGATSLAENFRLARYSMTQTFKAIGA